MTKQVLVIGGTRYFGKRLVAKLLAAGHRVTIASRGNAADDFGDRVERIRVNRSDRAAMTQAFADARYDLVYDQVCYNPVDAKLACDVFAGKVGRYVMASTIEVYYPLRRAVQRPFRELDFEMRGELLEMGTSWHEMATPDQNYVAGKRQAEACFHQDGRLPLVAVRIGHVLADGEEEFLGRVASYVERARRGERLRYAVASGRSSFIHAESIADFLLWTGEQAFLGPINAADDGGLTALEIHQRAAAALGVPAHAEADLDEEAATRLSVFDFPFEYEMDTGRARELGYRFADVEQWIGGVFAGHAQA
ncbi:NAD-dependent epimerase/dehydratase family protein [Chromobacterium subtsugae]|uniref:NAD-dependent epimerase/dehydratase family protein n=1 Tax=Chromobacterium subtsugae TaxID=251747 RepID=A0ABS7F873_9NEIS|nr:MULTISPECIES: NAD-dependent epimerase/dehydratase family protein [Chromobacterium]KUM04291.1 hypothetical protein Cv017_15265 [Chromobacterium subtsugae]KZE83301.1 hypothetical protein AWB61_06735 [Chromobacterium sp. F49]MBW7565225.1 NAD-dependent epimerase/dehydratase family protein [Chromobacterium subtsugae]MBW8286247.1 NAD-dependent epimerase/dehydratase family protein [Chromobacterium subtsugae]OBU87856.1 hypothetical protein MY55_03470 [Chromobacterium subtsugae]